MFLEIGNLLIVLAIIYFLVEVGGPAAIGDTPYFWLTKSIFGKKKNNSRGNTLEDDIAEAMKAVEIAKIALEKVSYSAEQGSSKAKEEYEKLKKIYEDSESKLKALRRTKTSKTEK